MKKKKTLQEDPHFKNHPFKSLKTIKASVHSPSETKTHKTVKREQAEDAEDLFLREMSGVRKMDKEPGDLHEPEKKEFLRAAPSAKPDEQQIFLQAMQKIGTVLRKAESETEADEKGRQPSSSRMRQLKRGMIRVREELDLHGHVRDEALVKLEHFVAAAYSRGEKAVLVITGKGINSPEGPVLQGAVSEWLRGKGRRMVAEFAPAPRDRGGSGAFVVFLKSRV
jgi:DNA-nicking Smr family endonuclease